MTIIVEQVASPKVGKFHIRIDRNIDVRISAEVAKRKASSWAIKFVSHMMASGKPSFVLAEKCYWRVPIIYTTPHVGHVGKVGSVEVDVTSGEVSACCETPNEMIRAAQKLAKNLPKFQIKSHIPEELIPPNMPPAPIFVMEK